MTTASAPQAEPLVGIPAGGMVRIKSGLGLDRLISHQKIEVLAVHGEVCQNAGTVIQGMR